MGQQLLFNGEHRRVKPIHGHVYRKLRFLVEACAQPVRSLGRRKRFKFQAVDDIPEKKGVDLCKQMSSSECSCTCICEIFWPLNPSTTTVYARSSFYPSQRFKASFTRREGYPCARVTLARGLKLALVYKQISQVGVSSGSTLPALLTCFVTRDIFCNGQKFEITLKFSVENTLNSQKREIIIVVDRK